MESRNSHPKRWVYVRRAVLVSFGVGLAITTALIVLAAILFGGSTPAGTYHLELGPLTFFTVIKELTATGSTSQLRPGFGVFVLTIILPVLAGALAWRKRASA